jgi:hypothetical protein
MKLYIMDGEVFVEIVADYLLHVASEEEVRRATANEIQEMVENAITVQIMKGVDPI